MYFWIEWKITFACKRSSFLLCWQSCLCLPVNCPGLHLLHCFPSSLLPKAGCLGPDEEKRKHNCARELPLHVHSALMHAVIRGCMDSLLHASIALDFSFGKFAPHSQGHSHSLGNVSGGHWFCSSSTCFVASRSWKLSNFLEQRQGLCTKLLPFQRHRRGGRHLSQQWLLLQPIPVREQMHSDADSLPVLFRPIAPGPSENRAQVLPGHATLLQPENLLYVVLLWCRHSPPTAAVHRLTVK